MAQIVILLVTTGAIGLLSWSQISLNSQIVINGTAVPPVPTLSTERVARGAALYAQNFTSCHRAKLESVSNWKRSLPDSSYPPPPHASSGHTWHHADMLLLRIIADGGDPAFNSKMPAFKDEFTVHQMRLILDFIKSKWDKDSREF